MIGQDDFLFPEFPSSPVGNELSGGLGVSSLTSTRGKVPWYLIIHAPLMCPYTGQLNKINDGMKKLLNDKLNIVRAMQGGVTMYQRF